MHDEHCGQSNMIYADKERMKRSEKYHIGNSKHNTRRFDAHDRNDCIGTREQKHRDQKQLAVHCGGDRE